MTGRPKGTAKTGGRELGTPNKPTFDLQGVAPPDGQFTPLSFALGILKDKNMPDKDRKWAARLAMPYVHPKLRTALADTLRGVTVEIRRFTDEEALAELDALGDPQGRAARMQAAESAMPYCHARIQPAATNAGGVEVQVRHVTHEQEEIDARGRIDKNNRKQSQPAEQAPPVENAMNRMEAEWFDMDNPGPAPTPALPPQMSAPAPMPAPTPTPPPPLAPPQPPAPAVVAVPVSHGTGHPGNGNGQARLSLKVVKNSDCQPRRINGTGTRLRPQTPRGERPKPRTWRDYPRTHPVHGVI